MFHISPLKNQYTYDYDKTNKDFYQYRKPYSYDSSDGESNNNWNALFQSVTTSSYNNTKNIGNSTDNIMNSSFTSFGKQSPHPKMQLNFDCKQDIYEEIKTIYQEKNYTIHELPTSQNIEETHSNNMGDDNNLLRPNIHLEFTCGDHTYKEIKEACEQEGYTILDEWSSDNPKNYNEYQYSPINSPNQFLTISNTVYEILKGNTT